MQEIAEALIILSAHIAVYVLFFAVDAYMRWQSNNDFLKLRERELEATQRRSFASLVAEKEWEIMAERLGHDIHTDAGLRLVAQHRYDRGMAAAAEAKAVNRAVTAAHQRLADAPRTVGEINDQVG